MASDTQPRVSARTAPVTMSSGSLHSFNLETMSGVFPGTHSQVHQRVWLVGLAGDDRPAQWAQLLWYEEPVACVLFLQGEDGRLAGQPLLRISEPAVNLLERFRAELQTLGWRMQSCGTCHFWQLSTAPTAGQVPLGSCNIRNDNGAPLAIAMQSGLALACPHWEPIDSQSPTATAVHSATAVLPLRKMAEISESKLPWWRRSWLRMVRRLRPPAATPGWTDQLIERSGVGAGTEPCLACQGRIANLGALAVETSDGDTQTFSVWRCRVCYTTYLNDWTDRWVRLDNLETEERYYRVAPAEALDLLKLIDTVQGGEHPGRRGERNAERAQLLRFLAGRRPLSHQTRQGR